MADEWDQYKVPAAPAQDEWDQYKVAPATKTGGPGQRFTKAEAEEKLKKYEPLTKTWRDQPWTEYGAGIADAAKGVYHALTPPPDPNHLTRDTLIDTAYPLARPIANMVGSHLDQAKRVFTGDPDEAQMSRSGVALNRLGHAAAAVTPGGPAFAEIGKEAPLNPPRAAGQLTGAAAMAEAPRIIPKVAPAAMRGAKTTARTAKGAAEGAAEQFGVKSLAGSAIGSSIGYLLDGPAGAAKGSGYGGALPSVVGAVKGGIKAYRNAPPPPVKITPGGARWGAPPPPTEPPPAVEPIQSPLPSGRTVGPAVPRQPPASKWGGQPPPTQPPPPPVEPLPSPLPSGRRAGPAPPPPPGAAPPPPEEIRFSAQNPSRQAPPATAPPPPASTAKPAPPTREPIVAPPPTPAAPAGGEPGGTGLKPPAAVKNTITERSPYPEKIISDEGVTRWANENGISEADAARQLQGNGYAIMNRAEINSNVHGIAKELGLDHATLSDATKAAYGGKGLSQITTDQLLETYDALMGQRGVAEPIKPKTSARRTPKLAKGAVVIPKANNGKFSKRGHWYGPKNALPKMPNLKQPVPSMPV